MQKNAETFYKCPRCDLYFETLRAFSSHLMSVHEKEIQGNKKNLAAKSAKKIIRTEKSKPKTITNLNDNNDESSAKELNHVCEICNTTFYSAKSLK